MERKITFIRLISLFALALMITPGSFAQVYQHDFGTTNITAHPYTVAPAIFNADLSASSWSNNTAGGWTSFAGSAGQAIALNNSSGNPAITLTFNVAAGKSLDITSFSFWRQRSNSGAQNWTMTINGINVGSGTVAQGGGVSTGNIAVANPVNGLTGTVTVVMTLSGASGTGTFRIDDFTLNGSVNSNCTAPVISSFTPASGPSNTLVTITGSGFEAGTTSVKFGGVESAGFTVVSDTEIKALIAATAATGNVTVTTAGCDGTSASSFTVISSNCSSFAAPTELFISEVYDAPAGEGGAIELYNGTSAPIDLSQYTIIRRGTIGGPATITLNLTGILAAGGVHIVRTNTSVCGLTGTPVNLLPSGFNEDDELELVKGTVVIDRVYTPDNVGFTMIRNSNATVPQAAFNAADWAINNTEDCANLGIHNITSSPSDHITAQPLSAAICEGDNVQYTVTLSAVSTFTYQWKMLNASGNWVNITDGPNFSGTNTIQLTVIDAPLEFNGAQFYCQATSPGCTLVSNAVQLTVSPLPLAVLVPVAPTCSIPTGGILIMPSVGDGLTYSIDGVTFQTGLAFNGLVPGNYSLTIKSSANCVSVVPFVVAPAPLAPAVADVTVTQPGCTTATGSITVNTPIDLGLTYSIDGTTFQNGTTFSNLLPGSYTITVMTALGCTSVTAAITIDAAPAAPAVATTAVTQSDCTTATGSISISAPVGADYTYSLDGTTFQASSTFSGLAPGTYTVTTQNADGCTSVTGTITINPAVIIPGVAVVTVTQPDCTTATGTLLVTSPVGAEYTYSIDGTTFQNSATFANLAPGTYTVTTQSTDGCTSATTAITINAAPAAPASATTIVTQPTCITPGSIEVTAPAGLEYSINGTTFQTGTTFANLAPGTYTVTTRNAEGCTSVTAPITVDPAPGAPAAATATLIQPTCTVTTGTITITAPVGNDYTYSIDGTNFQASTTFANLAPGNYTITTQLNGCTSTASVTINAVPAAPAVATFTVTQPTCTTTTGSIEITAPVGGGLSYSIDGTTFQNTTKFANLAPGSYTVTTRNADGCTSTATAVVDPAPGAPAVATTAITQPNCSGITTGTIEVTAPLGTEYTYSIDGTTFQSTTTFAGLAPGTYTVTTDNGGCQSVTGTITINPVPTIPAVADTTVTQPTCAAPTGTIVINSPTGAGFTYSIDGTTFQSGTTFANLAGGAYFVTVMNAGGCTSVTGVINVDNSPIPAMAQASLTQPTCFIGTGRIDVTSPTGSGFTYSIDGTTFQNGTSFINLAPGSYTVTVTNIDGCSSTASFTINAQPATPAAPALSAVDATCGTGTGSVTVTAPVGAQYSYSINGGASWQADTTFDGLAPGSYDVMVMTDAGCESAETTIAVAAPVNNILITGTQGCEGSGFNDTAYMLNASVVGADESTSTFVWTDSAGNQAGTGTSFDATAYADANGITAAQYPLNFTLTVTTAGGCTKAFNFTVDGTFCGIPRGISPNNDGKNDSFDISGMGANKVSIFNRYGQELYSRNNYTNEWNGQSNNGDDLPTGTYFYIIEHSGQSKTGWVYVNREQ